MRNSIILLIIFLILAEIIYSYLKKENKIKKNNIIYIVSLVIGPIINIIYSVLNNDLGFLVCLKNCFLFIMLINLIYWNIILVKKRIFETKTSFKDMKKEFNELKNRKNNDKNNDKDR